MFPWHNWIARCPPKAEVVGSTPAGDVFITRIEFEKLNTLFY